jgi:CheY-like chemotaxis protein
MAKHNSSIKSILLLDDEEEARELFRVLIRKKTGIKPAVASYPIEAIQMANKDLYDFILIDVSIYYRGQRDGGIKVHSELKGRYGNSSLIVYSKYVTDDWLEKLGEPIHFIEFRHDPGKFIDDVAKKMYELRKKQTCFIAMPFSSAYDKVFAAIKKSTVTASYKCIRIDKQQFNQSIISKIFQEMDDAKLVVFVATDNNPNAFYECGYAIAMRKEVIIINDDFSKLPFDISQRSAIAYSNSLEKLKEELTRKLQNLTYLD